jgi:hypothetical protein
MAMKGEGKPGLEEAENSKIRITLTSKSVVPLEKSTFRDFGVLLRIHAAKAPLFVFSFCQSCFLPVFKALMQSTTVLKNHAQLDYIFVQCAMI